ncbi:hypothetical protein THOM_1486 [Trachipleistophora hominis]|uniref:Uncharacterized protein n=1 Tax=Trachipleistophora hominis TaxID=72359 RepID=L7JVP7_TRAHO|nr:hypothetical protein THOM_1486 [Trachipleistophora hominis]
MYYEYLKLSSRTRVLEQKFFSARVAQFHKLYASLSDQIAEKDERIDTLKKQTTELQHKLEDLEEQNAEWGTNNNKLQAELDIVNKDVKRLQAISVEKERKIEKLNAEVESCRKEGNAASNAQIDRLERELEKLRKENAKLADRNKELIDKNKKLGNDKVLGKKNIVLEKNTRRLLTNTMKLRKNTMNW